MAKWGIRFQRFALSFRLSALDVCRFRSVLQPLALSLQPLLVFWAMPKGNPLPTNINTTILGTDPFTVYAWHKRSLPPKCEMMENNHASKK